MIDWESRYQQGDTPWDKGGPHPALASLRELPVAAQRILVPGCGLGHDVRTLAGFPGVIEVVGLDVAATPVAAARAALADLPGVRIECGDLFSWPATHPQAYDLVWEHTCFCAIDPSQRAGYVQAVAGVLRPGGHLLGVFFLTPWDTADENATCGPPFGCPTGELDRHFAARFETIAIKSAPATYPGREGREQLRLLRLR